MRVLVTGGTGFIGRALIPLLQREGHSVVTWVRSPERARSLLGADVDIVGRARGTAALTEVVAGCDAVVNLAGEALMARRWSSARRAVLETSRIQVTEQLVHAIGAARSRPRVLISGSAVGYYGNRTDENLTETSTPGDDFLASLCRRWEAAAGAADALGVRVVALRTGVVLGRAGGAFAQMLPPFKMGAGGPIGSGRQNFPWIHLHDLVKIVTTALVDERFRGPINGVAPEQATNRVFAKALGRALRRPALLPVPTLALRMIFGEAATVLLASQRVEPRRLAELGFTWDFPTLDTALLDIVGGPAVTITPAPSPSGDEPPSRYELRATTVIDAPLPASFAFFSKAENLGLITPAAMGFSIRGRVPAIVEGATIDYRVRVGVLPLNWRTRIAAWQPGERFVDIQESGPYTVWWHEHTFRPSGRQTIMEDRVRYTPPLGVLGRLAHAVLIRPMLREIFWYRGDVIRLRFGVVDDKTPVVRPGAVNAA